MICLEGDYSNEQLEELRRLIRHNGHTIDVSRHRLLVNLRGFWVSEALIRL